MRSYLKHCARTWHAAGTLISTSMRHSAGPTGAEATITSHFPRRGHSHSALEAHLSHDHRYAGCAEQPAHNGTRSRATTCTESGSAPLLQVVQGPAGCAAAQQETASAWRRRLL